MQQVRPLDAKWWHRHLVTDFVELGRDVASDALYEMMALIWYLSCGFGLQGDLTLSSEFVIAIKQSKRAFGCQTASKETRRALKFHTKAPI